MFVGSPWPPAGLSGSSETPCAVPDHARIDGVLESQIDSVGRAHAANRGQSFVENLADGNGRGQHRIEIGASPAFDYRAASAAPAATRANMLVGIDQARQHGGFR